MKTTDIKNILELQFGIKDEYTKEEYNSIRSLSLNKFDVSGEVNYIDFTELIELNNLEELIIKDFIIDNNIIAVITFLSKLKTLFLLNCEVVEDISFFFTQLKIENLTLDNTVLDYKILQSLDLNTLIINNSEINVPLVLRTNLLDIRKSIVRDYNYINLSDINNLIISNTQYENNIDFFNQYPNHLIVMEDNGEFVKLEVNK